MQGLKTLGAGLMGLAVVAGLGAIGGLFFAGIVRVSLEAFFYINWVSQIALLLSIFIFLPLALFRSTRMASAFGLMAASYAFGACVWIFGLIVTWDYWGILAVFLGMVVAGVGVVPLGMIAAAFKSDWVTVAVAATGLVLTFGTRALAIWLAGKVDRYNFERHMRIIDA
jgi:hypothetical protein